MRKIIPSRPACQSELIAAYIAKLALAPAPHESAATLAAIRADVLTITRAYGDAPVSQAVVLA